MKESKDILPIYATYLEAHEELTRLRTEGGPEGMEVSFVISKSPYGLGFVIHRVPLDPELGQMTATPAVKRLSYQDVQ